MRDCYDQFTWSSPSRWTISLSVYFNAIAIRWAAICPTSCIRRIAVFSDLLPVFLPLVIVPFLRLVPLVVVVVPFCVFSQSEMLNASLISSFIRLVSTISSFNRLVSTISSFNGFNNFQFYSLVSTTSSFIRLVSTLSSFIQLVSILPCPLTWVCLFFVLFFGTLLQEVYLLYMQYFFCLFLILVRPFVQFCSLLTKLYDILRGNSHWPYSLTKYFTFTIV